jgi:hypothetical protein
MALDLSTLLYTTVADRPSFLQEITLDEDDRQALLGARTALREGLRSCLRREVEKLVEETSKHARPKFVTQGSFSYKTINKPCRPPQQADLDDGIYLPLSYVQDKGQPAEAAEALFDAVAACAEEVARANGWSVETSNPRCTRVIVSGHMHIDIPLYSIPDEEFSRLVEAHAMESLQKAERTFDQLEEEDWEDVRSDRVLLATRNEGWLAKDPRPIRNWVNQVIEAKGEQLRRVMRYVKAWRDHQNWTMGDDPKSLMLMVAAERSFDEAILRRDDLALLAVVRRMADVVNGPLLAPWPGEEEDLTARLDKHDGLRADVVKRLREFAAALDFAINTARTAGEACDKLREVFGPRVPNRPDLVLMASATASPAVVVPSAGSVGRQNNA